MNKIQFSEANIKDTQGIARLHAQSWRENYKGSVSDEYLTKQADADRLNIWTIRLTDPKPNQWVLKAELEQQLIGFICLYGEHHKEYGTMVDNLHVESKLKGQKIGTQLLNHAANWAKQNFPQLPVYLEVLKNNAAAIGFYQSLGGKYVGDAIWNAPCGTKVDELLYQWDSPEHLLIQSGKRI